MRVLGTATRLVALAGLVWALGSLAAAINWHGTWMEHASEGEVGSALALEAQERWQHWVDMTLVGFAVVVTAVVVAVWLVLRDPRFQALRDGLVDRDDPDHRGGVRR